MDWVILKPIKFQRIQVVYTKSLKNNFNFQNWGRLTASYFKIHECRLEFQPHSWFSNYRNGETVRWVKFQPHITWHGVRILKWWPLVGLWYYCPQSLSGGGLYLKVKRLLWSVCDGLLWDVYAGYYDSAWTVTMECVTGYYRLWWCFNIKWW